MRNATSKIEIKKIDCSLPLPVARQYGHKKGASDKVNRQQILMTKTVKGTET
jgi:hypothetical protein